MECPNHKGRVMVAVMHDEPPCPTCGNNPPLMQVGWECHHGCGKYTMDGAKVEAQPAPAVAEAVVAEMETSEESETSASKKKKK